MFYVGGRFNKLNASSRMMHYISAIPDLTLKTLTNVFLTLLSISLYVSLISSKSYLLFIS